MRRFDSNDATAIPNLPTHEVRWSGASDDDGTIRTWFASIIAAIRFWRVGKRICREYSIDRVLAVYPHRYSLLVGWLIALLLRGAAIFLVIFVLILAVTLGWQWLTGAFG